MKLVSSRAVAARLFACASLAFLSACGGGGGDGGAESVSTLTPAPTPVGISLTVGTPSGRGTLDGRGADAYFTEPTGLAFDASGSAYVSQAWPRGANVLGPLQGPYSFPRNQTIRKITADGTVTTLAGQSGADGRQDGTGSQARFTSPADLAVAGDGVLYVVDAGRLRRVTTAGVVTTLPAPGQVKAVAAAPDGTLYLATWSAVYRYDPGVGATLVAGIEGARGSNDGAATAATFLEIADIAVDAQRTIYVSQPATHTLRRISADGVVTTFAGSQSALGSVDGHGSAARFSGPGPLALDPAGNLWVAEIGSARLRRVTPNGDVSTPYGNQPTFSPDGLSLNVALAFGPSGQLYVGVGAGIAKLDAVGTLIVLAGRDLRNDTALGDVLGTDPQGNLILARIVQPQSATRLEFSRYTAAGERLPFQASVPVTSPGSGIPPGYAADDAGNVYISEAETRGGPSIFGGSPVVGAGSITKVAPDGTVSTLTSWAAGSASTLAPADLRVGRDNALYFVDAIRNNLVKWTPVGGPVVLANLGPVPFFRNGWQIAADASGKVYVAQNGLLQRVENGGLVPVAGARDEYASLDGPGTQARFMTAPDIVADANGTLYASDGEVIRKVAPDGTVTTVAGQRNRWGLLTGALPGSLGSVGRIAIGSDGVLHLNAQGALVKIRLQ